MRSEDETLMTYIEQEVRALCNARGWGHQLRRKWSVRAKPVAESPLQDYEWKLLPGETGRLPDTTRDDFEGTYYVLRCNPEGPVFTLQHDTFQAGNPSPIWERSHYTDISYMTGRDAHRNKQPAPPTGWLYSHLADLTQAYKPNIFSYT